MPAVRTLVREDENERRWYTFQSVATIGRHHAEYKKWRNIFRNLAAQDPHYVKRQEDTYSKSRCVHEENHLASTICETCLRRWKTKGKLPIVHVPLNNPVSNQANLLPRPKKLVQNSNTRPRKLVQSNVPVPLPRPKKLVKQGLKKAMTEDDQLIVIPETPDTSDSECEEDKLLIVIPETLDMGDDECEQVYSLSAFLDVRPRAFSYENMYRDEPRIHVVPCAPSRPIACV
jgi:hypothetical protein